MMQTVLAGCYYPGESNRDWDFLFEKIDNFISMIQIVLADGLL